MSFLNLIFTALRGLAANKLRAILTTLGIIMGVASVIVMLALGNGARAMATRWRSPPESSMGRWCSRSPRPTCSRACLAREAPAAGRGADRFSERW